MIVVKQLQIIFFSRDFYSEEIELSRVPGKRARQDPGDVDCAYPERAVDDLQRKSEEDLN